jgi:hypothetical protein
MRIHSFHDARSVKDKRLAEETIGRQKESSKNGKSTMPGKRPGGQISAVGTPSVGTPSVGTPSVGSASNSKKPKKH